MGNWVSRETVLEETELRGVNAAPQIAGDVPVEVANDLFRRYGELVVTGFDTLQLPLHEIRFSRRGRNPAATQKGFRESATRSESPRLVVGLGAGARD